MPPFATRCPDMDEMLTTWPHCPRRFMSCRAQQQHINNMHTGIELGAGMHLMTATWTHLLSWLAVMPFTLRVSRALCCRCEAMLAALLMQGTCTKLARAPQRSSCLAEGSHARLPGQRPSWLWQPNREPRDKAACGAPA